MLAVTLALAEWTPNLKRLFSAQPQAEPTTPRRAEPELVPEPREDRPRLPGWAAGLLLLGGIAVGLLVYQSLASSRTQEVATAEPATIPTVAAETKTFTHSIRIGGTVGATNFAMIRAPRMEGSRDRGGIGGGLTIQFLAEGGSTVQAGDVVAEFESKRTQDMLDTYESMLAQTKSTVGTRKAEILIATETLRQNYRTTKSEADKAALDYQTAEVRSEIQAEIFRLLAEEGGASSVQLENEVRLQELADQAERRSLDISVEQDRKRMERTKLDLNKMRIRTPVSGLVVIETMFTRGNFQQASPGDQVYSGAYFMRVVDLSRMAVFANLNQTDSQMVRLGSPVKVRLDAYPDAVFEGRVAVVGTVAVSGGSSGGRRGPPGSRGSQGQWIKQVPVEVEILQTDARLQPDLSASADIIIEEREDALVIPRAALGTASASDAAVVWLQQGDQFVEREVEIDALSDTEAVVAAGLEAGELIAAQGIARDEVLASR